MKRAAARHVEKFSARTIHIVHKVEDALVVTVSWFEQDSSCAVAEQHASCAILVIQDRSHDVAADYQRVLLSFRAHKLRAHSERVEKTGARRRKIKPPRVRSTELVLNQAGGSGKHHVGSYTGDYDQVDVLGRQALAFEQLPCRCCRQIRSCHAGTGDMAFPDAGSLSNPRIIGIDKLLQVGIGHHPGRSVAAHTSNFCCDTSGHSVLRELVRSLGKKNRDSTQSPSAKQALVS